MVQNILDKAINEYENILKVDPKSVQRAYHLGSIHELQRAGDKGAVALSASSEARSSLPCSGK